MLKVGAGDKAPMYNIPSTLYGNIIETICLKGVYVDYFETVSSRTKMSLAVTAVEMKFQRFLGHGIFLKEQKC